MQVPTGLRIRKGEAMVHEQSPGAAIVEQHAPGDRTGDHLVVLELEAGQPLAVDAGVAQNLGEECLEGIVTTALTMKPDAVDSQLSQSFGDQWIELAGYPHEELLRPEPNLEGASFLAIEAEDGSDARGHFRRIADLWRHRVG